jgi:thioredoxin-related protein
MRQLTLILIGILSLSMFFVGYGVKSIEKAFDETPVKLGGDHVADYSEVVECIQKDAEEEVTGGEVLFEEQVLVGEVIFTTSVESGLSQAKASGKPIFIYFRSKSCGWCKKFETEILSVSKVASFIKDSFVPVSIEVNQQNDVSRSFRIRATPTMVFLNGDGSEIHRIRGYVESESFMVTLVDMAGTI